MKTIPTHKIRLLSSIIQLCVNKIISQFSTLSPIPVFNPDSGARAKNKASEREGKKRGETGGEDEGTPVKLILKSPCRPP